LRNLGIGEFRDSGIEVLGINVLGIKELLNWSVLKSPSFPLYERGKN
jgi:hypothetical protein